MLSEKNAIARESSVLIASAASDERVMKALQEVENLSKQLEMERTEHKQEVNNCQDIVN